MKLSLGANSITANIKKAVVNRMPSAYSIETHLEIIYTSKSKSFLNKSLFVFVSTSPAITKDIIGNNLEIVQYLTKKKESSHVKYSMTGLSTRRGPVPKKYHKNFKQGHKRTMVIDKNLISDMTLFVGIVNQRIMSNLEVYSLAAIDTLAVLKNGGVTENNILLFEDSKKKNIYLGKTFQDNAGRWYKQSLGPTTSGDLLYTKIVPNTKVIYKSQLDEGLLKTVANTFNDLYNINKGINSKQAIVNNIKTKTRNYFSSLHYAKTHNLLLPISFSFNRLDFFRNNGVFSKLIKNETEMINSFDLISTTILRKRIIKNNPSNRLTGAGPIKDFGEKEYRFNTGIRYVNLFETDNILTVMATDTEINNVTYGLYSYGVEFTFVDNTYEKLMNILNQADTGLNIVIAKLEALYAEMTQPGNYDVYDEALNDAYIQQYKGKGSEEVLRNAIKSYVSAIALFHKDLAQAIKSTPDTLAAKLFTLADPLTSGPQGLLELLELMLDLAKQVERYGKINNVASQGDAATLQTQSSKMGSGARIVKIKHYFDEVINADDLVDNGFDYLTVDEGEVSNSVFSPFRQISYNKIEQLITVEKTKYDNLSSAPTDPVALTPNYFNLMGYPIRVNSKEPNQEERNTIVATSLLAANKYQNSPIDFSEFSVNDDTTGAPLGLLSILKNNLKVMAKENCTILIDFDAAEAENSVFSTYQPPVYPSTTENYLDAAEKMSEESPFVVNKSGSVSLANFLLHTTNNISQEGYYTEIQKMNNNLLSYLVQTDYYTDNQKIKKYQIKNITDQNVFSSKDVNLETFNLRALSLDKNRLNAAGTTLSTLLLGQAEPEKITPQELNYATYLAGPVSAVQITAASLKYGNIRKIQYLAGFRKLNDSVMMKEPLWITLTNTNLENFTQSGKTILCKMAKSYSEFSEYRGIRSPFYDELFLLSPGRSVSYGASTAGNPGFSILAENNFNLLNNLLSIDHELLQYSTSLNTEIMTNNIQDFMFAQPPALIKQAEDKKLYTNGGDFLLPNGENYIGYYHLHYKQSTKKFVAMVGRAHTNAAHDILKPISPKAKRTVAAGKKALVQSGTSTGGRTTGGTGPAGY